MPTVALCRTTAGLRTRVVALTPVGRTLGCVSPRARATPRRALPCLTNCGAQRRGHGCHERAATPSPVPNLGGSVSPSPHRRCPLPPSPCAMFVASSMTRSAASNISAAGILRSRAASPSRSSSSTGPRCATECSRRFTSASPLASPGWTAMMPRCLRGPTGRSTNRPLPARRRRQQVRRRPAPLRFLEGGRDATSRRV